MDVDPLGILFGATGALIVQLVVQLVIIPRVESRKRREDRWEKDVLTLGELLATELPDLESDAKWAQAGFGHMLSLQNLHENLNEEKRLALIDEYRQKARVTHEAYQRITEVRVPWLVARITSADPTDSRLSRLYRESTMLRIRASMNDVLPTAEDGTFDEEKFNKEWADSANYRKSIAALAFELSQMSHPPRRATRFGPRRIKKFLRRAWIWFANAPGIRTIMEQRAARQADQLAKQPPP